MENKTQDSFFENASMNFHHSLYLIVADETTIEV